MQLIVKLQILQHHPTQLAFFQFTLSPQGNVSHIVSLTTLTIFRSYLLGELFLTSRLIPVALLYLLITSCARNDHIYHFTHTCMFPKLPFLVVNNNHVSLKDILFSVVQNNLTCINFFYSL